MNRDTLIKNLNGLADWLGDDFPRPALTANAALVREAATLIQSDGNDHKNDREQLLDQITDLREVIKELKELDDGLG